MLHASNTSALNARTIRARVDFPYREDRAARVLDVIVASVGLVVFAPLMLLIAAAILLTNPGPVIFAHRRVGRGGAAFPCLKFRTMVTDAEARLEHILATDAEARAEWARDHKLRRDPRITWLGRFLRQSSLDELPQLFNVLRGEMSIVGPRPIVAAEQVFYGRAFANYCSVRPGITGLWQISGRNDVSYRRRVALDVMYSRTKSLRRDLQIIAYTVPAVLFAVGSY